MERRKSDLSLYTLKQEIDSLKAALQKSEAKAADYYARLSRHEARISSSKESILRSVLSLLDVIELTEPASHKLVPAVESFAVLFQEFKRFLAEEGLEEISPAPGERLNMQFHHVVGTTERGRDGGTDRGKDGTIGTVVRKGYHFQGKVLRTAHVTVSK